MFIDSSVYFPGSSVYLENLRSGGFFEHASAYEMVYEFSQLIRDEGGEVFLVGGSVRDIVMGTIPKDFDVEVYGLDLTDILSIAERLGSVHLIGKSFGIIKLSLKNGIDIDIALPRKDSKVGV